MLYSAARAAVLKRKVGGPPSILAVPHVADQAAADPQSVSYTIPSAAANRLIVAVYDDGSNTVTTITWTATGASGQSLTQRRREANGATSVELWDLINPNFGTSSGSGTLSIDRSASAVCGVAVYALSGAHSDAPVVTGQNGALVTDPAALAIDPEPNSIIFDFVCGSGTATTATFDGAETEDADATIASTLHLAVARKTSVSGDATTVNVAFSAQHLRYGQIAAAYKGVAG